MSPPQKLNFITGNKNKLSEVRAIIGNVIDVESQSLDIPEIQGTSEEIAREKCRRAAEVVSLRACWNLGLLQSLKGRRYVYVVRLLIDGGAGGRSSFDRRHGPRVSCSQRSSRPVYVSVLSLEIPLLSSDMC